MPQLNLLKSVWISSRRKHSWSSCLFRNKSHSVLAFFDLGQVCDTTWRHHLFQQLSSHNIGVFIKSFLSHRTFRVRFASSTSTSFLQVNVLTSFLIAVNRWASALPPGIRSSLHVAYLDIFASDPSISVGNNKLFLGYQLRLSIFYL